MKEVEFTAPTKVLGEGHKAGERLPVDGAMAAHLVSIGRAKIVPATPVNRMVEGGAPDPAQVVARALPGEDPGTGQEE
ncbi:hypothetical protein [Tropicimonas sp. IMCC34043]|uniref:hypothetical protein n=1 Tax=Tropicimonas sp. IMCC34043 TaxID=2248760 RepID=UPI000E22BB53|nr:hypothetical protein [Tropicimonas sp. IMCC34043]